MSKLARSIALPILINAEAFGLSPKRPIRTWGKGYETDEAAAAFLHLAVARRLAEQNQISKAVFHYIQAYRLSKAASHPSGIISALNGMAWRIKERHPFWAHYIAQRAVFWLGYYREEPGNLFGALDTLFEIEKSLDLVLIAFTAKIIASMPVPKAYAKLASEAKSLLMRYGISFYPNTKELRSFIKNTVGLYRKEKVSAGRLSEIITGKTKKIRGDTLRKIMRFPAGVKAPFPVWNEWVKTEVETSFKEAMERIKEMAPLERKRRFLATYMAQVRRKKLYISRKDKLQEAFELLGHAEGFEKLMGKRHETMEFVIEMVKAHPCIEGRKKAAGKALSRMGKRKLERFTRRYIKMKEKDKELFDRYLRNYGRYDGIRFGMRFKRPEVVREFARMYSLKIQTSFAAFWEEEDGRVRERLERILRYMVGGKARLWRG